MHNDIQPSSALQHQVGALLPSASAYRCPSTLHTSQLPNSLTAAQSRIFSPQQEERQQDRADISTSQKHHSWQQQQPANAQQPRSAPNQPEARHNSGQDWSRPVNDFDSAKDLASSPHGNDTPYGQRAQPQFMAGLMGLHGVTTPEEKRRREDKQKQYARELDEQVSTYGFFFQTTHALADALLSTTHSEHQRYLSLSGHGSSLCQDSQVLLISILLP